MPRDLMMYRREKTSALGHTSGTAIDSPFLLDAAPALRPRAGTVNGVAPGHMA